MGKTYYDFFEWILIFQSFQKLDAYNFFFRVKRAAKAGITVQNPEFVTVDVSNIDFTKIDMRNVNITKSLSPMLNPLNAQPPKSISRINFFPVKFGDRLNSTEKIFEEGSGGRKKAAEAISGLQNRRGPFIIKKI